MLSIIVPIYNAEQTVKYAIKSVLKQTYSEWKLILVDDGSTDNSLNIINKWASIDERIIVIHQKNRGASYARKVGYDYCERFGKDNYVTFLDSDDAFADELSLESYMKETESGDIDIICANYSKVVSNILPIRLPGQYVYSILSKRRCFSAEEVRKELCVSFFGIAKLTTTLCGKMYKWNVLYNAMNYKERPKFFAEDLFVNMFTFPIAQNVVVIPRITYLYAIGGGTSKFMPEFMNDALIMYKYKMEALEKYPIPQNGKLYVQIELRNLLYVWLDMYVNKQNLSVTQNLEEIKRCRLLPEVEEMLSNPYVYNHQYREFTQFLEKRDYHNVLNIIIKNKASVLHKIKGHLVGIFKHRKI